MASNTALHLTPYEIRVRRNIEENQRVLQSLGLQKSCLDTKRSIKKTVRRSSTASNIRNNLRSDAESPAAKSESPASPFLPTRRTRRSSSILQAQGFSFDDLDFGLAAADEENTPPHKKKRLAPEPVFGPIEGVSVGDWWSSRIECSAAGVHRPWMHGIHGKQSEGCYSIALSGGYEDDIDYGEYFTYTGSGGRDLKGTKSNPKNLRTAPQTKDQVLEGANATLAVNVENRRPVRVIRGYKLASPYAPEEGYRYDGLYSVEKYWTATGLAGFKVFKYALKRLPDQDPPPWVTEGSQTTTQNGHGNSVDNEPICEMNQNDNEIYNSFSDSTSATHSINSECDVEIEKHSRTTLRRKRTYSDAHQDTKETEVNIKPPEKSPNSTHKLKGLNMNGLKIQTTPKTTRLVSTPECDSKEIQQEHSYSSSVSNGKETSLDSPKYNLEISYQSKPNLSKNISTCGKVGDETKILPNRKRKSSAKRDLQEMKQICSFETPALPNCLQNTSETNDKTESSTPSKINTENQLDNENTLDKKTKRAVNLEVLLINQLSPAGGDVKETSVTASPIDCPQVQQFTPISEKNSSSGHVVLNGSGIRKSGGKYSGNLPSSIEKIVRFSPQAIINYLDGELCTVKSVPITDEDLGNKSSARKLYDASKACFPVKQVHTCCSEEEDQPRVTSPLKNSNSENKKQTSILKYFGPVKKMEAKPRGILLRSNRRSFVRPNCFQLCLDSTQIKNDSLDSVSESPKSARGGRKSSQNKPGKLDVVLVKVHNSIENHQRSVDNSPVKQCVVSLERLSPAKKCVVPLEELSPKKNCYVSLVRLNTTPESYTIKSTIVDCEEEDYFLGWDWATDEVEFLGFGFDDVTSFIGFEDDSDRIKNLLLMRRLIELISKSFEC